MAIHDKTILIATLMETSGVQFGTSGARGLVEAMTDEVCFCYTLAFLQHLATSDDLKPRSAIAISGDLRPSTQRIMLAVTAGVIAAGYTPHYCGTLPSPAVAYYGLENGIPSIMVTGSHIPDDRNGIKFNKSDGEILKTDEEGIRRQTVSYSSEWFDTQGQLLKQISLPPRTPAAYDLYRSRYLDFFGSNCLQGLTLGLYEHSTVGRDIFFEILTEMGANVIKLARSGTFIPVDTEAIRQEDIVLAENWASQQSFDAVISADGDADRPLISDENGKWLRGDIAGILCAQFLNADCVVTPVSSNTAVEKSGYFKEVRRTRIGSPFVIEEMNKALRAGKTTVVGYEANGGFLIASPISRDGRVLKPLPTRDALIVPLTILLSARQQGQQVSALLAALPQRYTASDRIKNFPTQRSQEKIKELAGADHTTNKQKIEKLFGPYFREVENIDVTDGLRITFSSQEIVHLRPSGNAPEFRCYNEANTETRVAEMQKICMGIIKSWV